MTLIRWRNCFDWCETKRSQLRHEQEKQSGLIQQIQKERKSSLICYVTSTRPGLDIHMAMDAIRPIYDNLENFGKKKRTFDVDLFLHSNGGDVVVPWRLVTLIKEYAKKFSILVPFRAFSAATLAALGADEIVMHPMGMLGPTDPTVTNAFNPRNPTNPNERLGISVEDVTAYIALIKEDAGIHHEDELVIAFNKLADHVHPLALGNVKRFLSQSRMVAKKLLALHMDKSTDEHKIREIVDNFTSKLFFHGHPINRVEARSEVGLNTVVDAPNAVEKLMWKLYLEYETEGKMNLPFAIATEFVQQFPNQVVGTPEITNESTAKLVFVESVARLDVSSLNYKLTGTKDANGATKVNLITTSEGWTTEK